MRIISCIFVQHIIICENIWDGALDKQTFALGLLLLGFFFKTNNFISFSLTCRYVVCNGNHMCCAYQYTVVQNLKKVQFGEAAIYLPHRL